MKYGFRWYWALALVLVALALGGPPGRVLAQNANDTAVVYSQEELDQLLAPVALYPDALLAQLLSAATYPLEVVQAARFVQQNPGLKGEALGRSVEAQGWEPSVASLAQFPSVLVMMNDKLEWTQQLGDAFLGDSGAVMSAVQGLRAKAQAAGNLQSNDQQRIVVEERYIVIEPARPQVVFVPYYNPTVVYGAWWWPARPPWFWIPPPIYRPVNWGQAVASSVVWSVAIGITRSIWFDVRPSWRDRQLTIINVRPGRLAYRPGAWVHNPAYRQGVAYRDVLTRDRFAPFSRPAVDKREPARGRDDTLRPAVRPSVQTPGVALRPAPIPSPAIRPALRPSVQPPRVATRPAVPSPSIRPAPQPETKQEMIPAPRRDLRPAVRPAPRTAPKPLLLQPGAPRDITDAQAARGNASRTRSKL